MDEGTEKVLNICIDPAILFEYYKLKNLNIDEKTQSVIKTESFVNSENEVEKNACCTEIHTLRQKFNILNINSDSIFSNNQGKRHEEINRLLDSKGTDAVTATELLAFSNHRRCRRSLHNEHSNEETFLENSKESERIEETNKIIRTEYSGHSEENEIEKPGFDCETKYVPTDKNKEVFKCCRENYVENNEGTPNHNYEESGESFAESDESNEESDEPNREGNESNEEIIVESNNDSDESEENCKHTKGTILEINEENREENSNSNMKYCEEREKYHTASQKIKEYESERNYKSEDNSEERYESDDKNQSNYESDDENGSNYESYRENREKDKGWCRCSLCNKHSNDEDVYENSKESERIGETDKIIGTKYSFHSNGNEIEKQIFEFSDWETKCTPNDKNEELFKYYRENVIENCEDTTDDECEESDESNEESDEPDEESNESNEEIIDESNNESDESEENSKPITGTILEINEENTGENHNSNMKCFEEREKYDTERQEIKEHKSEGNYESEDDSAKSYESDEENKSNYESDRENREVGKSYEVESKKKNYYKEEKTEENEVSEAENELNRVENLKIVNVEVTKEPHLRSRGPEQTHGSQRKHHFKPYSTRNKACTFPNDNVQQLSPQIIHPFSPASSVASSNESFNDTDKNFAYNLSASSSPCQFLNFDDEIFNKELVNEKITEEISQDFIQRINDPNYIVSVDNFVESSLINSEEFSIHHSLNHSNEHAGNTNEDTIEDFSNINPLEIFSEEQTLRNIEYLFHRISDCHSLGKSSENHVENNTFSDAGFFSDGELISDQSSNINFDDFLSELEFSNINEASNINSAEHLSDTHFCAIIQNGNINNQINSIQDKKVSTIGVRPTTSQTYVVPDQCSSVNFDGFLPEFDFLNFGEVPNVKSVEYLSRAHFSDIRQNGNSLEQRGINNQINSIQDRKISTTGARPVTSQTSVAPDQSSSINFDGFLSEIEFLNIREVPNINSFEYLSGAQFSEIRRNGNFPEQTSITNQINNPQDRKVSITGEMAASQTSVVPNKVSMKKWNNTVKKTRHFGENVQAPLRCKQTNGIAKSELRQCLNNEKLLIELSKYYRRIQNSGNKSDIIYVTEHKGKDGKLLNLTNLHVAVLDSNIEEIYTIVEIQKQYNKTFADINRKDVAGKTALDYAILKNLTLIVDYLEENTAKQGIVLKGRNSSLKVRNKQKQRTTNQYFSSGPH